MSGKYILAEDGKTPVPCDDLNTWCEWFENRHRIVKQDYFQSVRCGELQVSTVFLGIDHRFLGDGPPLLWETMVFRQIPPRQLAGGHVCDREEFSTDTFGTQRYSSYDEALKGHELAVSGLLEMYPEAEPVSAPTEDEEQWLASLIATGPLTW